MTLYPVFETALIGLIGVVSVVYAMKALMPRFVQGARASVARRLGRGAPSASWRHVVASKVRQAAPQSGCGTGCSSGCHGCRVAARINLPASGDDQSVH